MVSLDDLKKVIALSELPEKDLRWILDHSEYHEYSDGELIARYGEPAEEMWILLSGKIVFYMYIMGRQVYYFTFGNNPETGGIGALIPYSRMKTYPGYSYASGEVKILCLHKNYFTELELLNPAFIQKLIGYMTERAKTFATTHLQHEKMHILGNLAAGVAHELNNPAAAIRGIADELSSRVKRNYELTTRLITNQITGLQLKKLETLIQKKENLSKENLKQSTLQRLENEAMIEYWQKANGIMENDTAETFAEFGFSIDELEQLRNELGAEAFTQAVPWLENILSSQKIIKDLVDASVHITNLVTSIKSHVHMDRSNELQLTNIHLDIENTLTLLGFKIREKKIEVKKKYGTWLPDVPAYVGELNQVWTNLIDNAIYALEENGVLTIETSRDDKHILVKVMDNGKGIPKEILPHIFEPFFTTKKAGNGTGIGLDIVDSIIKRHNGYITVNAEPGNTTFIVSIPLEQKKS